MTQSLLATFGAYGGSFLVALIAGLFPIVSIEVFLLLLSGLGNQTFSTLLVCCLLATAGHQIAKTVTYYAGVGALERGRLKAKIEANRERIDRWNRAPYLILVLSGSLGIPPMYLIGFIAEPLMRIRIVPYTLIVFATRLGRFVVLAAIPQLF